MASEAEKLIGKVFYNSRTGYGSVEETYKNVDPSISRTDVREFMMKQEIRQQKKPAKNKINSFVAQLPRQEFQVDLLDMGNSVKPFRYGFVCIDIFTKKGVCIPIRTKTPEVTTKALKETFREIGYPASTMCDDGTEFKGEFAEECRENEINIVLSITGGRFVERFIRTLKYALHQRTRSLLKTWDKYVYDVVDKYNETVHSSTHETPDHVAENEYDFKLVRHVFDNQMSHAKFPTKHPELNVGDHVKIRIKQKSFYKETFDSWTKEVYTITSIDEKTPQGTVYHLEGYRRPLLRFELKKVTDVQRFHNGNTQSVLQNVRYPLISS